MIEVFYLHRYLSHPIYAALEPKRPPMFVEEVWLSLHPATKILVRQIVVPTPLALNGRRASHGTSIHLHRTSEGSYEQLTVG